MSICEADSVLCRFCQRAEMAMAGQGCGELETSPDAASQGRDWWPQGLTGGPGLWSGLAAPQEPNKFHDACNPKPGMKFHFVNGLTVWVKHKSLLGRNWTLKATVQKFQLSKNRQGRPFHACHRNRTTLLMMDKSPCTSNCTETQLCQQKLSLKQTYETLRIGRRF